MKNIITLLISFLIASGVFAQSNPLGDAVDFYKAGKLKEARTAIEKCMADKNLKKEMNTWYLRGFIMKDIYKTTPAADSSLYYRLEALQAFKKLTEMPGSEKYTDDALKNIKYLSSTFYNDAIAKSEVGEFDKAQKLFEHFKSSHILSRDKSLNLEDQEIQFLLALGSKYADKAKKDSINHQKLVRSAKDTYNKVLKIDPKNSKANYNMGVLYYNEAVNMISKMDYDEVDLIAISQIEDQSIDLFKQSLPFMEVALKQDPNDRNVLEGLAGIYFSLRDYDKSNSYKEKMESLKSN